MRLALWAFLVGGWLARRGGLGVTLVLRPDPRECTCCPRCLAEDWA